MGSDKLLDNVNVYFLSMIIFSALWMIFVDGYNFKKKYKLSEAKKARFIGITFIAISLLLFVIRKIIS